MINPEENVGMHLHIHTRYRHARFLRWRLCCLLLLFLLVSCSSANNSAETALVTTTATSSPARVLQPRVDGGDESLLARQLARVQL